MPNDMTDETFRFIEMRIKPSVVEKILWKSPGGDNYLKVSVESPEVVSPSQDKKTADDKSKLEPRI